MILFPKDHFSPLITREAYSEVRRTIPGGGIFFSLSLLWGGIRTKELLAFFTFDAALVAQNRPTWARTKRECVSTHACFYPPKINHALFRGGLFTVVNRPAQLLLLELAAHGMRSSEAGHANSNAPIQIGLPRPRRLCVARILT